MLNQREGENSNFGNMQVKNECEGAHEVEGDLKSPDDQTDSEEKEYDTVQETERDFRESGDSEGTLEYMVEVECSSRESDSNSGSPKVSRVRGLRRRPLHRPTQVRYGNFSAKHGTAANGMNVMSGDHRSAAGGGLKVMTADYDLAATGSKVVYVDQASAPAGSKRMSGDQASAATTSNLVNANQASAAMGSKLLSGAATGSKFMSGSEAKGEASDGMRSGSNGTATIVGEGRKCRGKRALSRGQARSFPIHAAMHTRSTREACSSRFHAAKGKGPGEAVSAAVAPKGSDACKALLSAAYTKKPNSAGTIHVISDRALPGHAPGAAVTTACMWRLRVWVQSGGQLDSSDETELNP